MSSWGLELEGVTFHAGGRDILHGVSMRVPQGSFAGILGGNGAGKSTLLKCINGINSCTGSIRVCGRARQNCTEQEFARLVSLMNQNTNLEFSFTCRQVVEFGRYPYWKKGFWSGKGDQEIVEQAMRYTDTLELADTPVTCISGGERQRVLFAKILAQDTQVILLDEPTANLDLYYQRQLFSFGREQAERGKTVLAAIHDLNLALPYCDRFYLIAEGRLIAQGTAREVMTSEHLKAAYHLETILYQNPFLPQLELSAVSRSDTLRGVRIHLTCGGGSGRTLLFQLWSQGAELSVSPLPEEDLDALTAETFQIPICPAAEAAELARRAKGRSALVWTREEPEHIQTEAPQFEVWTQTGLLQWRTWLDQIAGR